MRPKPPARRRPRRAHAVRPLLLLRRHPRLWWAVAGLVAAGVGWSVAGLVSHADQAARAWGSPRSVVVAARDLEAGHEIGEADVVLLDRPAPLMPSGAVTELPLGRALRADVYAGEVLLTARLAPPGARGLAARLPAGGRAVAVPVEPSTAPPLAAGDHVDVLVALAPELAGGGPPGFTLAPGALVLDVGEHAVTLAVPADVAPRIAAALGHGAVTLALTASTGP